MTKIDYIAQTYILLEVFDNPYDMQDVSKYVAPDLQKLAPGVSNLKAHKLPNSNDMIVTWHKDDAMEIHHIPSNFKTIGSMVGETPNPRFIATALSLGKQHIESGGKVRIITSQHTLPSFKSLGDKVTKRQGWKIEQSDGPIKDQEFYGASNFPEIVLHSLEISKK